MSYDVREIANLVLDVAEESGKKLTNLDINKIVFFVHGWFLAKTGRPLVSSKIEAWTYGPVFRELYSQFSKFGPDPIKDRAQRRNPKNLTVEVCVANLKLEEERFLRPLIEKYIRIRTSDLVKISHVKDGPWDRVYNHEGKTNPGMEISNAAIAEYFSKEVRH